MKVLLVKLPEPKKPTQKSVYMPPIGLWSIAANIKKWGMEEVYTTDLHLLSRGQEGTWKRFLFQTLNEIKPDIVGLSVQFSIQHDIYLDAAEMCLENSFKVIAGGFHAKAVDPPPGVTVAPSADGELCFGFGKRFEDIEYPDITAHNLEPYWVIGSPHDLQSKTERWIPVEFSRGCSRRCGYCGVNGYWGNPRYYAPDKIRKHLDGLVSEGIEEVFIEDDNIISDDWAFSWIIRQLADRGIWWSTPNGISIKPLEPYIPSLPKLKCWRVSLPFETGSDHTARIMGLGNKWVPRDKAKSIVDSLKDEGVLTCGFFIIGYPGETLSDMTKTLDYANSLPLNQGIYI